MSQLDSSFLFLAVFVSFTLTVVEAQFYMWDVLATQLVISLPTSVLSYWSHGREQHIRCPVSMLMRCSSRWSEYLLSYNLYTLERRRKPT